mmetsp:Transcript_30740/g.100030  ORF Transcript_30740/g.100030 Transcript_30740/m.100030 type:complete len:255 (+) Transcript_30740:2184-2948(+)
MPRLTRRSRCTPKRTDGTTRLRWLRRRIIRTSRTSARSTTSGCSPRARRRRRAPSRSGRATSSARLRSTSKAGSLPRRLRRWCPTASRWSPLSSTASSRRSPRLGCTKRRASFSKSSGAPPRRRMRTAEGMPSDAPWSCAAASSLARWSVSRRSGATGSCSRSRLTPPSTTLSRRGRASRLSRRRWSAGSGPRRSRLSRRRTPTPPLASTRASPGITRAPATTSRRSASSCAPARPATPWRCTRARTSGRRRTA